MDKIVGGVKATVLSNHWRGRVIYMYVSIHSFTHSLISSFKYYVLIIARMEFC